MKNKLFVIIIFCSSCLFSQYTETINSNRPGTSHGAFSVGRDVLQFEVGLKNYSLTHSNLNNSKINYPFNEIEKFYLFESKRWDIVTKDKQTIKLPIKNYEISLKNFIDLKDQINFRKYKIFDYRINNQIILK